MRILTSILALFVLLITQPTWAQSSDSTKVLDRFFMPSIQMGYLHNIPNELTGSLIIQTSLEYKTRSGLFFRLNYDTYDAEYTLQNPLNALGTVRGEVSFSEVIGGAGFRVAAKKHHFLVLVQAGFRFFDTPLIVEDGNNISVVLESQNININRYSLGYEYEITKNTFIVLELFGTHTWRPEYYWQNTTWSVGATLGVSTTIF